jgi:hypothetical protein
MHIKHNPSAPPDSDVVLPADVKATIARADAALKSQRGNASTGLKAKGLRVIISIINPDDQVRREKRLKAKKQKAAGRRGQPPMTDRLRNVSIYVDHLERHGEKFATARKSRMNRKVREWLNERMANSEDARKSRRKLITEDAVTALLKQVAKLRSQAGN